MNYANLTARNILDVGLSPLFDTGQIDLLDGTQPADADTAITTQVVLGTITLPNPAFAAATDAAPGALATANAIAPTIGIAAGTTTWGRAYQSGGVTVIADLTVGSDIIISNPVIAIGSPIDVTLFTLGQPES